ncbi:MAG: C/D box methylation guide ribonucleoprotein complex aNOP56 subunit [Thermosphaera aggregans]|jgi:nucleolar protein 56|uniref:C/D box methylation guide ribonucleoprotein complex aNOP56 subunit n=1 Tax=Thermosphaera aggregans TaxID=54254 RepID=UPI003BFF9F44
MTKAYLVETFIGILVFDESRRLILSIPAPSSIDDHVEYLLKIENGEETPQLAEALDKLRENGFFEVEVEHLSVAKNVSNHELKPNVLPAHEVFLEARGRLSNIAVETGLYKTVEEYYQRYHEIMMEYTRRKLRREAQKRDLLAVQAIRAIDDIDKTINLYIARLREWYSIHFPELDELVKEHPEYAKLVFELGDRGNFTVENLRKLGYSAEKAQKLSEAAKSSIGADLSDFDLNYIKILANIVLELYKLRDTLDGYIEVVMKEVAPNITAIVGPKLGARLMSLAGGLERLAKLPASTIQVLGAEKALFRALRTGGKPPKHGVLFQYPPIHKSPRWQRGKIARTVAAKLAIAAKIDFFSGRFIGDKLVKEIEERIEEIKKLYAKPPVKKEEERPRPKPKKKWRR